jgi:hypothetical protein
VLLKRVPFEDTVGEREIPVGVCTQRDGDAVDAIGYTFTTGVPIFISDKLK